MIVTGEIAMQLEISKHLEESIRAKAAAAGFDTVEQYILDGLELDEPRPLPRISREQWLSRFDTFVARQTSRNPHFDDSRESIYPVR